VCSAVSLALRVALRVTVNVHGMAVTEPVTVQVTVPARLPRMYGELIAVHVYPRRVNRDDRNLHAVRIPDVTVRLGLSTMGIWPMRVG
jgi:CBS-domain-containing membrane protein